MKDSRYNPMPLQYILNFLVNIYPGLELAYHQAPFAFQGYATGMFVLVVGLSHFGFAALVTTIDDMTEACDSYGLCSGNTDR